MCEFQQVGLQNWTRSKPSSTRPTKSKWINSPVNSRICSSAPYNRLSYKHMAPVAIESRFWIFWEIMRNIMPRILLFQLNQPLKARSISTCRRTSHSLTTSHKVLINLSLVNTMHAWGLSQQLILEICTKTRCLILSLNQSIRTTRHF